MVINYLLFNFDEITTGPDSNSKYWVETHQKYPGVYSRKQVLSKLFQKASNLKLEVSYHADSVNLTLSFSPSPSFS